MDFEILNKLKKNIKLRNIVYALSIIEGQSDSNRIKLLIVNEECGF